MSALIEAKDLASMLGDPGLKLIDATWPVNPEAMAQGHIGDAISFDIDRVCDPETSLPHMLPDTKQFSEAAGYMGIGNDDTIVVYDQTGLVFAAARVWWMFRVFGHKKIRVLNGGLPAWKEKGFPLKTGIPPAPAARIYTAQFQPYLVVSTQDVQAALHHSGEVILDARPADRFAGITDEPRPGMRRGHIPGSLNIPALSLIDPETRCLIHNNSQITKVISSAPANIITTCGSGVTACVLTLALYEAGWRKAAVYDGSWAEWGAESAEFPVESGK